MPIVAGPEQVDTVAVNKFGSFFYLRPVFIVNGSDRWIFMQQTKSLVGPWQLKAYLRVAGVWMIQDAANGPLTNRSFSAGAVDGGGNCPTYIQFPPDPTKVIAAYARSIDSQLSFTVFDLTTKTWGLETSGGPIVHGDDVVFAGPPASTYNDDTGAKVCLAYRPSDNKLLFNFQGAVEVVTGANCLRPHYVTYDLTALVWSVETQFGFATVYNPFQSHGLVCDQNTSISYATFVKPNGGTTATTQELWYAQIDADNTIHSPVLVTDTVLRNREPYIGYPKLQFKGSDTILNIPFICNAATQPQEKIQVARCLVGIAPSFLIEDVSVDSSPNSPWGDPFLSPSICIASDNKPYVFWGNAVAPDFVYKLWMSFGNAIGEPWSIPDNIYTVADTLNDVMEFLCVEFLPGI